MQMKRKKLAAEKARRSKGVYDEGWQRVEQTKGS